MKEFFEVVFQIEAILIALFLIYGLIEMKIFRKRDKEKLKEFIDWAREVPEMWGVEQYGLDKTFQDELNRWENKLR